MLNDLLKVNIWRTGIYQSVFSNSGNKPELPTQDDLPNRDLATDARTAHDPRD